MFAQIPLIRVVSEQSVQTIMEMPYALVQQAKLVIRKLDVVVKQIFARMCFLNFLSTL